MATTAQVLALLTGAKVFDGGVWRVYDAGGAELADPGGVLWRGVHGALLWGAAFVAAGGVNTDTSQGVAGKGYIDRLAREEYNRANRLAKDDALVVDLLTALFTGGFFDGC